MEALNNNEEFFNLLKKCKHLLEFYHDTSIGPDGNEQVEIEEIILYIDEILENE